MGPIRNFMGLLALAAVFGAGASARAAETGRSSESSPRKPAPARSKKKTPARSVASEAPVERLNVDGTGVYQPGGENTVRVNSIFDSATGDE